MKVKELIEILSHCNPESEIVSEGADCGGYDVTYRVGVSVEEGLLSVFAEDHSGAEEAAPYFPNGVVFLCGDGPDFWDFISGRVYTFASE